MPMNAEDGERGIRPERRRAARCEGAETYARIDREREEKIRKTKKENARGREGGG